jgi:hypothetical protein
VQLSSSGPGATLTGEGFIQRTAFGCSCTRGLANWAWVKQRGRFRQSASGLLQLCGAAAAVQFCCSGPGYVMLWQGYLPGRYSSGRARRLAMLFANKRADFAARLGQANLSPCRRRFHQG